MRIDANPQSPAAGAAWAAAVAQLRGGTPKSSLDTMLSQGGFGSVTSMYTPGNPTYPAWYVATVADWTVVVINGCETTGHGLRVVAGYVGGPSSSFTRPLNSYYEDFATEILSRMGNLGFTQVQNYVIVGYSMGGAVAQIMATRTRQNSRQRGVRVVSFGAPSPAHYDALTSIQTCLPARYFNIDDPVPLVPPAPSENLSVALVFPANVLMRFARFAYAWGGLEISEGNVIEDGFLPTNARLAGVSSLASWLVSADTNGYGPHGINTYVDRLASAAALAGQAKDRPIEVAPGITPDAIEKKAANAATDTAVDALRDQEVRQHLVRRQISSAYQARVVNLHGVYAVYVGNTLVSGSTRPRSARAMARKINAMLDATLVQGLFNPVGFESAMAEFVKAATDGSGQISPALSTGIVEDD